jgi:hypothetical protein
VREENKIRRKECGSRVKVVAVVVVGERKNFVLLLRFVLVLLLVRYYRITISLSSVSLSQLVSRAPKVQLMLLQVTI